MGNEESTLADEIEHSGDDHGLTIKIKPRIPTAMDTKATATGPQEKKKKKPQPRQAGLCRHSWTCCKCKYLLKSGKWSICQRPSCRHERCAACTPEGMAVHQAAEHITNRRWPAEGLCFEDKIVQLGLCERLAVVAMQKEIAAVRSAKEAEVKVERDLWGRRTGEWPGGF